jgi:hypothetical protein
MTPPTPLGSGEDPHATTCLACGAARSVGHLPTCPASQPDTADLLVETLGPDSRRTWLVSGLKFNLTPARRTRFAAQMPKLLWLPVIEATTLPFSLGALVNEIVPQMGIANGLAAVGYNASATVAGTDCGCTDLWRCRCDFPYHPFRYADPDLWPDYQLVAFKVRYHSSWSVMWLLDIGIGAVWVADDVTTTPPVPRPITRRCYLGACASCPGQGRATTDVTFRRCACPCHDGTQRADQPQAL